MMITLDFIKFLPIKTVNNSVVPLYKSKGIQHHTDVGHFARRVCQAEALLGMSKNTRETGKDTQSIKKI